VTRCTVAGTRVTVGGMFDEHRRCEGNDDSLSLAPGSHNL